MCFVPLYIVILYLCHVRRKDGETAMKVCNTNWSDQWSNFVCQSLGFTETKTTNFRPSESNETSANYLKLKDESILAGDSKSLTGYLEQSATPCETVEIKCSSKHRKIMFLYNDDISSHVGDFRR